MLYVITEGWQQFDLWCRSRGWSPRDRGIRGVALQDTRRLQGIRFQPGDLVIETEIVGGLKAEQEEAYRHLKSIAPAGVAFRYEPTLGSRHKAARTLAPGERPNFGERT